MGLGAFLALTKRNGERRSPGCRSGNCFLTEAVVLQEELPADEADGWRMAGWEGGHSLGLDIAEP